MSVLSSFTIGLGIAHFVGTYFLLFEPVCNKDFTNCVYALPGIFGFLLPGVWGSIGVFATGLIGMKLLNDPKKWRKLYIVIAVVSIFLLVPGMIAISVANVVLVSQSPNGVSVALYDPNTVTQTAQTAVLFYIPIVIASIGALEHILITASFFYVSCCFKPAAKSSGAVESAAAVPPNGDAKPQYRQAQRQTAPGQLPAPDEGIAFRGAMYNPAPRNNAPYGLQYKRPTQWQPAAPQGPLPFPVGPNPRFLNPFGPAPYGPGVPRTFVPGRLNPYSVPYYPTGFY